MGKFQSNSYTKCDRCGKSFIKSVGWLYKRTISNDSDSCAKFYCSWNCLRSDEKEDEDLDTIDKNEIIREFIEKGSYIDIIASKHKIRVDTVENIIKSLWTGG